MIRGIVFDLDGTLLDTIADLTTACNLAMQEYNFPTFTKKEIQERVGNGNKKLIERCLPEGKKELTDEVLEKFFKHYANCYKEQTIAYEGILDVLLQLQENCVQLAINTNKQEEYCNSLVANKLSGICFKEIIGSRVGIPNKPDPYSLWEIIEKMQLNKDEVLYVGDSEVDVQTAKNAGVVCAWVSWGFRRYEEVESLQPEYQIHEPKELLNLMERE